MDPSSRARVEAWLRYGDEIGLGPYYVDRASLPHATAPRDARPVAENPSPARSMAAAPAQTPQPASLFSAAPNSPAKTIPILGGASLFESAERVEGDTLDRARQDLGECTRCKLHKSRTKIVFGVGNSRAELVFIGEGPGRDEDLQGEPFVGRAGKLLTQMIEAMSLRREDVYICNVVKCRPPENRLPENDEIAACSPFLLRQLDVIRPKVIVCLGACASQTLLQTTQGISRFRGEWFDFRGSKLIATYHPAYLLRNPAAKADVWKDLQKVMAVLGLQARKR
ncbi:MAG: uracil-DNA glycosylase [Candidatus Acidiferrales bacterium]